MHAAHIVLFALYVARHYENNNDISALDYILSYVSVMYNSIIQPIIVRTLGVTMEVNVLHVTFDCLLFLW